MPPFPLPKRDRASPCTGLQGIHDLYSGAGVSRHGARKLARHSARTRRRPLGCYRGDRRRRLACDLSPLRRRGLHSRGAWPSRCRREAVQRELPRPGSRGDGLIRRGCSRQVVLVRSPPPRPDGQSASSTESGSSALSISASRSSVIQEALELHGEVVELAYELPGSLLARGDAALECLVLPLQLAGDGSRLLRGNVDEPLRLRVGL
jgi:hypothetical protein